MESRQTINYALEATLSLGAFTAALFEHKCIAMVCIGFTLGIMARRLIHWTIE